MNLLGDVCHDAVPGFLGLFDLSIAPQLLYYSYIPIIVASALIGFYVFYKDKRSLKTRLLLVVTIFFILWVLNILVQWVGAYNTIVMLGWQLTAVFEVGMFLSAAYFAEVFLYEKDISFTEKIVMTIIAIATLAAIPTSFNVAAYDIVNCEGTNGLLWNIIYAFEPAIIVLVAWRGIDAYRQEKNPAKRKQINIFTIGIVLFLTTFFLSNYYGELTKVYQFNLWGPLGMVVFLILLAYLIVRYKTFNIKLIGAQALILSLIVLIGSEFFFIRSTTNQILTAITLIITGVIGINLIRSVKKEVAQRELLEQLTQKLEETNDRQESLIHFIGHEVKGFLTNAEGAFAALSDGDFGTLPETLKPFVGQALAQTRDGVSSVSDILKASNQKKGTIEYKKESFDLSALAAEIVEKEKPMAERKGLALSFSVDDTGAPYTVNGDKNEIGGHVFKNLIDNSINYTPSGSVSVSLKKENGKFIFTVKDTGIGITQEDKKRLFTEGGHGKDSQKVNVHSTGYGLYIAKNIMVAHGGTIRAESEGEGKGSTFIVELPA